MADIKQLAQGTTLAYGDGATPEVFVPVAHIKSDVPFPSLKTELKEVTDHDSVGGVKEKIGALIDPGEMSLDIYYLADNTSHKHLITLAQSRAIVNWKITMVDEAASVWTFAGLVTEFTPKAPIDDAYQATVKITVSGKPTPPA